MASRKRSWSLRLAPRAKTWSVRIWLPHEGRTIELSTGERDPEKAHLRGAQLAAEQLAGKAPPPSPRSSTCERMSIVDAGAKWLEASSGRIGERTVGAYAQVINSHLAKTFESLLDVSHNSVRGYIDARLRVVQTPSVRHELSVLRQLTLWAAEQGLISEPPNVPGVPRGALGTAFERRRRVKADEYSPDEIRAFIAALPEQSLDGVFVVRARLELQYETALRSSTLDRLSVPEHWRPGERQLRLARMVLKSRRAYTLPLTDRAVEILTSLRVTSGLVFGWHDYTEYVRAAAEQAMPQDKAEKFAQIHLRSARATHLLEMGVPLGVVQQMLGHNRATTTDRYVRTSVRATEQALRKFGLRR